MKKMMVSGVVAALALWSVWSVVVNPSRVANYGSDGWFINWVVNNAGKNFWDCFGGVRGSCGHLFDGNIFYPYKNVMAYSDMFFISGFWTHWLTVLSKNPGLASGLVMGAGQVLTMLIVYFWWNDLTKNRWSAAVGAIVFGLSQIRWEYRAHLHTWTMQYWLVGVWLMTSFLRDGRVWKLYLGVIVLALQMWEAPMAVYFGLMILITYIVVNRLGNFNNLKHIVLAALLGGLIIMPVIRVYSGVAKEFGFVRSIRDAAHGGMSVNDLGDKFYSSGLFVLLAVSVLKLKKSKTLKSNTKFLLAVVVLGVVMAMGPVLKWQGKTVKIGGYAVPLPYAALYYVVPGMKAFREPSRWILVSALAASGLVAMGLANKGSRGILAAMVVAIVGGTHLTRYIDLPSGEEIPLAYRQLDEKCQVIVETPVGGDERESKRMYYSLYHGRYLVNGFSGFSPPLVGEDKYKSEGVDCRINWQNEKAGIDYL